VCASVVELELWSRPGASAAPFDGKVVAARCRSATGLSEEIVLGLNFVPDIADVDALRAAVASGELRREDFALFCEERGLDFSLDDAQSAAAFLAYAKGQPLAWLHVPAEPAGLRMASALAGWALRNGMELKDGARTYEPLTESQFGGLWE
jgi:hypothetical protein